MNERKEEAAWAEFKTLALEVKADADGHVEGYASRFNEVDAGGDVVVPGAFARSLAEKPGGVGGIKMLWQHDPSQPIGKWDEVFEDETGLFVRGRILTKIAKGAEVAEMIREGIIDGMSIGYRTLRATRGENGERQLLELDLWEVSMVTFPMLSSARIDAVKAGDLTQRECERRLMQDAGFSRSVARTLMGGGFEAVKAMQDAGDGGLGELAQFMRRTLGQGV
ncbi:HK97 family phage prohead protease [Maritimibacter alexandrii]|uniref:HK97 family phage prohead protease n=1 Tax=Maritimibacter alexandrii TaxID=2570355 RepID=UPI00110844A1|nr:HK97 family phage prohead protease [Maritimibacter alexandrii]